MRSKKNIFVLKFINTLLFIALIFIQYNAVFSIKILRANPMLPIALLVAVCMFCSELTAAISSLIVGIFIDGIAATPQGFNAIVLLITGLAVSLIVRHLFNNNIFSALALCAMAGAFYFLLRWLFCYAFLLSFTENLTYLIRTVFPSVIYTTAFVVPFYYLEKTLYKKYYNDGRYK